MSLHNMTLNHCDRTRLNRAIKIFSLKDLKQSFQGICHKPVYTFLHLPILLHFWIEFSAIYDPKFYSGLRIIINLCQMTLKRNKHKPVFMNTCPDIRYSSKTTRHSCMYLKALEYLLANFQVVRITSGMIQEIGGLQKFRSQWMLTPMNLL